MARGITPRRPSRSGRHEAARRTARGSRVSGNPAPREKPFPSWAKKSGIPKARAAKKTTAKKIVQDFRGEVPSDMDELLSLPGVARKTANVVLGTWFGKGVGVVVDTHVTRIARRLELTRAEDAPKIEQDLMRVIPQARWIDFAH